MNCDKDLIIYNIMFHSEVALMIIMGKIFDCLSSYVLGCLPYQTKYMLLAHKLYRVFFHFLLLSQSLMGEGKLLGM